MGLTVTCEKRGCSAKTFGYWQTPDGRMFCEEHGPETKGAERIGEKARKAQEWGGVSGKATRTYRIRGEGRTIKAKPVKARKVKDTAKAVEQFKARSTAKAQTSGRKAARQAKAG